uniref:peptidylprolyl isomerase n=1 Tax=Alexandrium monilatum TaxID=311494 RepID=A0A7S4QE87_9DINO
MGSSKARAAVLLGVFCSALAGVTKDVIEPGDGVHFPHTGDTVTMHYTGRLTASGKKFDSSVDRGQPFQTQIGVGQVIKGWDEGVPTMSLGEKAVLRMTPDFGYGSRGAGGVIPPNADLTFEVELLRIEPAD